MRIGFTSFSLLNPCHLTPKPRAPENGKIPTVTRKKLPAWQYPEALLEKGQPCPETQQSWPRAGRMLASPCLQQKRVRGTKLVLTIIQLEFYVSVRKNKNIYTYLSKFCCGREGGMEIQEEGNICIPIADSC